MEIFEDMLLDIGAAYDDGKYSQETWPLGYGEHQTKYSPWVATLGLGTKINLGYFYCELKLLGIKT